MNSFTFRMQTYDNNLIKTNEMRKNMFGGLKNILHKSLEDSDFIRKFANEEIMKTFIIN